MRAAHGTRWIGGRNAPSREWRKALLAKRRPALALFAFTLVLCVLSALEVVFHGNAEDFLSFYAAARAAAAGIDFYDHVALEQLAVHHGWGERVYPYLYPPFLAHVLRPLAVLELPTARRIWLGANVVAYAASVSLMLLSARRAWRTVTPRRVPSWGLLLTLSAALVWALPLRNNLLLGQVNPLVLLLISLAVRAHLLGRSAHAGLWLACAVMIKITPVVLLLFFLLPESGPSPTRHHTLLACVGCLVAMAAASLGLGAGPDWLSFLRHAPERTYGSNIPGLFPPDTVWNFAPAGWLARLLPEHAAWVPKLSLITVAGACSVTVWLSLRATSPAQDCLALASLFPVVLLASPLTYLHHVIYLLPAIVIWLLRAWSEGRHIPFGTILLTAFVAGTDWAPLYGRLFGPSVSPALTSINLYAVLASLAAGWVLMSHGSHAVATSARTRPLAPSSMRPARARGD